MIQNEENRLDALLERIRTERVHAESEAHEDYAALALCRWDTIQHPLYGLGVLEDAIVRIAGLTQTADVRIDKKAVVVIFADNGVVKQQVSQTDSSVTGIVAGCMVEGKTSVCRMAHTAGADVIPVDMGIRDFPGMKGILNRRIANGTSDILYGPAMSREDAQRAILTGIDLAGDMKRQGYRLLGAGEMGIGNTTTASACASVLLRRDPGVVTGKGAGLSDQGLGHKIEVVRAAIEENGLGRSYRPNPDHVPGALSKDAAVDGIFRDKIDTVEVLRRVGGFDLLGMCGLYIGGWIHKIPLLIDGFASSVAALAAARICPECVDAMLASHVSSEPAARLVLDALGKKPLITAGLHLGEGTGAVLAMPMLDMALSVYHDSCTFEEGGVEAYRPL